MATSGHYHCGVKGVGRGTGAGVIHKAAYRAGECLFDARGGAWTADYRGRGRSVIEKFILTRDAAAAWRGDRQRLWNAAEAAEARRNGRLATELELGLPHELTAAQRKRLLMDFLAPIIARYGIAADVAIHTAHDRRNIHAHILLTHRQLGPDGFGEIANARTVTKKVKGREKLIGIAGIVATPADIHAIRKAWAEAVNRAYAMAGFDIRVDHRSFEERGIRYEPTRHLGPAAAAMERRGERSDRGDINRAVARRNAQRHLFHDQARRSTQRQVPATAPRGAAPEALQTPKRLAGAGAPRQPSTRASGHLRAPWRENSGWVMARSRAPPDPPTARLTADVIVPNRDPA